MSKQKITRPAAIHRIGRFVGTHFRGIKGVDRLLRTLHHPDQRQHSWMETIAPALPEGPRFHLSTKWFTEWTTWFYGSQDEVIHQWICQNAKTDWVAFDVGMNFGYFTCLLAQRSAQVHGFEPVSWLAKRARANVELNGFRNTQINEVALSAEKGDALLNLPSESDCNWGTSSLVHSSSSANTVKVPLETLDNYVRDHALQRLDFMKIDVEGAEHLVIQGGLETIKKYRPTIIFESNQESFTQVCAMLESAGYAFFGLQNQPLEPDKNSWSHDILAAYPK